MSDTDRTRKIAEVAKELSDLIFCDWGERVGDLEGTSMDDKVVGKRSPDEIVNAAQQMIDAPNPVSEPSEPMGIARPIPVITESLRDRVETLERERSEEAVAFSMIGDRLRSLEIEIFGKVQE